MFYQIFDLREKNSDPELAFQTYSDSIPSCIDEFISMLVDLIGEVNEHDEILITKLQQKEYYRLPISDEHMIIAVLTF